MEIKNRLAESQMVFSIPSEFLTVKQNSNLRNKMPEGTTMSVVKNTVMKRAIADSDWEASSSLLKGSNQWFFVGENIKGTLKEFTTFLKEEELKDKVEIKGGVIDGGAIDAAKVAYVGTLPSKKELIAKIAGGVKMVPTKLARVLNQPPTKVARAIKLAGETRD